MYANIPPFKPTKYILNTPNINHSKIISDSIYTPLNNEDILPFHKSLTGYTQTSLYELKNLATSWGVGNILLKNENERYGLNSFKSLGASYSCVKEMEKAKEKKMAEPFTLCTATDGNHGRAVSWIARITGNKATIFVPKVTKQDRIDNIKNENAEVIVSKGDYDTAVNEAFEMSKANNWLFIQDMSFDNYTDIPLQIMAGYTTIIKEVDLVWNGNYDFVFLQAGVGSFASAIIYYLMKNHKEENFPKIVVVEPIEVDCIYESIKEGKTVSSKGNGTTIMAGLDCMTPSSLGIPIIQYGADLIWAIHDSYSIKGMNMWFRPKGDDVKVISGESGVAGLAGLIALMTEDGLKHVKETLGINEKSKVLIINTEGDTDKVGYEELVVNNKDYC